MADQLETAPMDDKALFNSAMADEPAQDTPAEQSSTDERPRDDQGRFAPKDAQSDQPKTEQPKVETPPGEQKPAVGEPLADKDEKAEVPSWRLRELREERDLERRQRQEHEQNARHYAQQAQALQRRLQELEHPKTPPDMFENPTGFVDHGVQQHVNPLLERITQLERQMVNDREAMSKQMAIGKYGEEAVNKAYQDVYAAAQAGSPDVLAVIEETKRSVDPVGALMRWHTQKSVLSKIGNDPEAWFEKTLQERLSNPDFQAKTLERLRGGAVTTQSNGRPAINLPPSLNRAAGAGNTDLPDLGDLSDKGLFRDAVDTPVSGRRR